MSKLFSREWWRRLRSTLFGPSLADILAQFPSTPAYKRGLIAWLWRGLTVEEKRRAIEGAAAHFADRWGEDVARLEIYLLYRVFLRPDGEDMERLVRRSTRNGPPGGHPTGRAAEAIPLHRRPRQAGGDGL